MARKVDSTAPTPCAACPWRIANFGKKPDPGRWYTRGNLARLWKRLRRGESMTCHPTDPENPIPEGSDIRPVAADARTIECAGALILQQREFMKFQAIARTPEAQPNKGLRLYRKLEPRGLTREGILTIVERAMFGGTALGAAKMTDLILTDEEIGYEPLPWNEAIARAVAPDA